MAELTAYDCIPLAVLEARTGAARLAAFDTVASTMDTAHELARAGAVHGTIVLAHEQTAGRGRERRGWQSGRGGVWLTLIVRGLNPRSLGVLPLRTGVAAAEALEAIAAKPVGLKWPNDLYLAAGKVGGVLVEARLRGEQLEWAAVGMGINLVAPERVGAAGLGPALRRGHVVERLVPALLAAASREGPLNREEIVAFDSRDIARGREITAPVIGVVAGIDESGSLLVESGGVIKHVRSGSLILRASTEIPAR